ncbi:multicopper oxidase domain-containing protein [Paenibacillus terreus]|uniref:Multicopper oxidase domain-containing protein n=1 Tax=Paenibacillus terreus TaxID=1387834 RepID=A0ABV5BAG9_9BACL
MEKPTVLTGKEINLTASVSNQEIAPGQTLPVWTFNNSVPGPQIRVTQGETIKVNLKNQLPEPVTIHWHGVPVPKRINITSHSIIVFQKKIRYNTAKKKRHHGAVTVIACLSSNCESAFLMRAHFLRLSLKGQTGGESRCIGIVKRFFPAFYPSCAAKYPQQADYHDGAARCAAHYRHHGAGGRKQQDIHGI